jgi:Domain of unknown function (DUF5666)
MNTDGKKLRFAVLAITLIVIYSSVALAHGDQQHVMGVITAIDASSISVKTTTGEVKVVMIQPTTKFLRGTSAITQQDVKVGTRVVIHAKPEGKILNATEVKVGGAVAASSQN